MSVLLSTALGALESTVLDVDARLVRLVGHETTAGSAFFAVLSSLAACWIAWKFLVRCQLMLKLRRLSRSVPCVR